MAKEGLFNILNNRYVLQDLAVLDLFSGTGNISFEFASRGTMAITAIDAFPGCVQFISKTSKELDFPIKAIKADVFKYLEKTPLQSDIIFADPPYDLSLGKFEEITKLVFSRNLLNDEGLLILEHSSHTNLSEFGFFAEARKYGGSIFSFFKT